MAKAKKQWMWAPQKPKKIPDSLRRQVSKKAEVLVRDHIRDEHVKPQPKNTKFNYIVEILTKWRGRYFYFIAKYTTPGPDRIAPFFEVGFARLEFVGDDRFDLAYFRHTGKWWTVFSDLTVEEALDLVKSEGIFTP